MKIRKGDTITIISGNDKGHSGKVISVLSDAEKIVVEGVNLKKKHMRPRRQGQKGEIVRLPAPFSASRAMLVCSSCKKATRAGYTTNEAGGKVRVCKKCGNTF